MSIFFGETNCSECTRKAYYETNNEYRCGLHSKKDNRTKLKKNPKAKERRETELKLHKESVKKQRKLNTPGSITCYKMKMMKSIPLKKGVLNVFPNNKHKNRKDGYGCASLSPMQLGPVKHGQKRLPDAKSIENYHQFNKCFPIEQEDGEILLKFYKKQRDAYNDPIPHRHKFKSSDIKKMNKEFVNGNVNIPMFSIHKDGNGKERRYTYVESRFFYCIWYEKLALEQPHFQKLKQKLEDGYNLCICGYDAYQPTEDLYTHYCDKSRPFGHELVLYSLLIGEKPWRRYYEEHKEKYVPLSFKI